MRRSEVAPSPPSPSPPSSSSRLRCWHHSSDEWQTVANDPLSYHGDPLGEVNLTGVMAACGTPTSPVFTLPEGFRPPASDLRLPTSAGDDLKTLVVEPDGTVSVPLVDPGDVFSLNGLSIPCGPSGQDGCP